MKENTVAMGKWNKLRLETDGTKFATRLFADEAGEITGVQSVHLHTVYHDTEVPVATIVVELAAVGNPTTNERK